MQIHARIISLNPQAELVQNLQSTLQEAGIAVQIFPAVDGRRGMPPLLEGERLSQTRALVYRRAPLSSSEVGCYLSHLRAIRQAYEANLSHICIFEDDVVAEPGLGELLREIVQLGDDFHLVRLMSLKIRKRKVVQTLPSGYSVVRPLRGALGTQGYVLNRIGMQKLLEASDPIHMPIDKIMDSFFLYDLHCFSVEPHAIYEQLRNTNVAKTGGKLDRRLWVNALWFLNKLNRSIRRRLHYLRHYDGFYPAVKPSGRLGKSQRIR